MMDADRLAAAVLDVDVAIIGSGPAGLAVALALIAVLGATGVRGTIGNPPRVLVLEAGGTDPEIDLPAEVAGATPYPQSRIGATRAAGVGGTAGIWSYRMSNEPTDPGNGERGCRYAPLDEVDFEARPEIPHSGWPFTRADVDPWIELAQPVCGIGPADYTPKRWIGAGGDLLPLDPELVETQMFQFGPRSAFTTGVVSCLERAGVRIRTGADVTDLDVDGEGRVSGVRWRNADGTEGAATARAVVLAGGGIENSRLLLRTADGAGPGLGNRHDQVGRYWMEHPIVRGGLIVTPPGSRIGRAMGLYDAHWQGGTKVMGKLSINPDLVRRRGLVSTAALFLPRHDAFASAAFQSYTALRSPSGRAAGPRRRAALAATAGLRAADLLRVRLARRNQPGTDDSGWTRRAGVDDVRVLEMIHQTEQTPHPDNRIVLGGRRDRLGRPVPVLHWHWSEDDRRRVTEARDVYARAFEQAGLGHLIQGDWDRGQPRMIASTHHHMGGTRMSPDDRTGVVDADGKVHGSPNLYVAGSSIFPTGGSVNPTLVIVALALRLGAHLRGVLATA